MTDTTLAERLGDVEAAQTAGVARNERGRTVFDLIRDHEGQFARALPSTITPERFTRVALTVVRNNPELARCNSTSLLGSLMLCAQLGLDPGGPLGHAYLVPFKRECTFILGYRGMIDLARRSGHISSIYAELVYDGDRFEWTLGLHRDIIHEPTAPDREDDAKVTHVYAVARFTDPHADPHFVVLTRAQVEKFRGRSRAKSGPWFTDWGAMAQKTAVRRLSALLPMSVETARGLEADETRVELDIDGDVVIDVEGQEVSPGAALPEQPGDEAPTPGPTEDSGAQNESAQ